MPGQMDIWKRRMSDMANTQYIDLLREILNENEDGYGVIEIDGDGYNDYVFIWEGYSEKIAEFNELCKAKLKANGIDTYPDYDREEYYIDFITGDNWGYYDSYYVCDHCGKAYRYPDYGTHDYFSTEYGIICGDCVRENKDIRDDYLESLINNPKSANGLLGIDVLEELGFEQLNEDTFENGMYGTCDCPTEIYELYNKAYPNSDIVFHISSSSPFAVYFDVYIRKADEDEGREVYMNCRTKELYTLDEMKQYCKENYDYGNPTNAITYMENWYGEYGFKKIA